MPAGTRHKVLKTVLLTAVCGVFAVSPFAADDESGESWIDAETQHNLSVHRDNPDLRITRGLLADRKHRIVELLAVATGVNAETRVDTFIAGPAGNAASSIAISAARRADVQAALEFIGLSPGHPVDPERSLFWPRGERVIVTFHWSDSGQMLDKRSARAESLLLDASWNETLPELGLRFVGPAERQEAAVDSAPVAVAYNARDTLLELPWINGDAGQVTSLTANPDLVFVPGQKLRIRIRPEYRNGQQRVIDFVARIAPGRGAAGDKLANLQVDLAAPDGEQVATGGFEAVYVYLEERVRQGEEPFLTLQFSDDLDMESVRNVARFADRFLTRQDIRVEPAPGQLFFTALLPREEWRNPALRDRGTQPVEIHWRDGAGDIAGELFQYPQAAGGRVKQLAFSTVEELQEALHQGKPWHTDGVFLMMRPELPYKAARILFETISVEFPHVYIFL